MKKIWGCNRLIFISLHVTNSVFLNNLRSSRILTENCFVKLILNMNGFKCTPEYFLSGSFMCRRWGQPKALRLRLMKKFVSVNSSVSPACSTAFNFGSTFLNKNCRLPLEYSYLRSLRYWDTPVLLDSIHNF